MEVVRQPSEATEARRMGAGSSSATASPCNKASGGRITAAPYRGMLPCLRHGFSNCLFFNISNERQMRLRVSCG